MADTDDVIECIESGDAYVRVYHTNDGDWVSSIEFDSVFFTREDAELREAFTEACGDVITQIAAEVVDDYASPEVDDLDAVKRVLGDASEVEVVAAADYLDVSRDRLTGD